MIRIWREPEVAVRSENNCIVQTASECSSALADIARVELPIADAFWLFRPQMNGYNVHDGVRDEVPLE